MTPADPNPDHPTPVRSDSELMAAVAAGDREAFELVYSRYAPPIMSFLHHLCFDRQLAEDATQETFVRAWQAASRFRPGARLAPWLYTIAQRTAWSAGSARSRRGGRALGEPAGRSIDAGSSGMSATGSGSTMPKTTAQQPSPSDARVDARATTHEVAAALSTALTSLSEALRVAFVLVRMEGLSYDDAAEVLDVPVGTVKSRVAAAETHLRDDLRGFS